MNNHPSEIHSDLSIFQIIARVQSIYDYACELKNGFGFGLPKSDEMKIDSIIKQMENLFPDFLCTN